ncbi:hypothetical protein ACTFIU_002783 [Dictyostelium citrinum]
MKFLAVFLILISILGLSSAVQIQHINAKVYCGAGCSNPTYSDVSVNVNQCIVLPEQKTCGFALPYILVSPRTTFPNITYTVTASIGCNMFPLQTYQAVIGVCNSYQISGVQFSILADLPEDGEATNSSNSLKPKIVFFSALLVFIISLIL